MGEEGLYFRARGEEDLILGINDILGVRSDQEGRVREVGMVRRDVEVVTWLGRRLGHVVYGT